METALFEKKNETPISHLPPSHNNSTISIFVFILNLNEKKKEICELWESKNLIQFENKKKLQYFQCSHVKCSNEAQYNILFPLPELIQHLVRDTELWNVPFFPCSCGHEVNCTSFQVVWLENQLRDNPESDMGRKFSH